MNVKSNFQCPFFLIFFDFKRTATYLKILECYVFVRIFIDFGSLLHFHIVFEKS